MMPLYSYRCPDCGEQFDIRHGFTIEKKPRCPSCGAETEKIFFPVMVQYKGKGFYVNDSKQKG